MIISHIKAARILIVLLVLMMARSAYEITRIYKTFDAKNIIYYANAISIEALVTVLCLILYYYGKYRLVSVIAILAIACFFISKFMR